MADKHSLNYEVRELKLGASFTNNKSSQYHTIKYDFKPASVDVNKMATVDVGTNNQVTVTVPHLDGAGVPQTVFKGSQRPYTKECVLIIDRVTGEVTLEKLSSNIQVKKTRQESAQKLRPLTPVTTDFTNTTQRSSSRTKVATNKRTNHNTGAAASAQTSVPSRFNGAAAPKPAPQHMVRSPQRPKTSPPQAAPRSKDRQVYGPDGSMRWSGGGNSTLASLPMIGLDDAMTPLAASPVPQPPPQHNGYSSSSRPQERYNDRMSIDRSMPERFGSERMPERMANDRIPNDRMAIDRVVNDRMANDRIANDRMANDRMANERMANERMANERMAQERMAQERPLPNHSSQPVNHNVENDESSSSSSSDSGSDSDSDSDDNDNDNVNVNSAAQPIPNGTAPHPLPTDVLNDDLCLSESGSDSD